MEAAVQRRDRDRQHDRVSFRQAAAQGATPCAFASRHLPWPSHLNPCRATPCPFTGRKTRACMPCRVPRAHAVAAPCPAPSSLQWRVSIPAIFHSPPAACFSRFLRSSNEDVSARTPRNRGQKWSARAAPRRRRRLMWLIALAAAAASCGSSLACRSQGEETCEKGAKRSCQGETIVHRSPASSAHAPSPSGGAGETSA